MDRSFVPVLERRRAIMRFLLATLFLLPLFLPAAAASPDADSLQALWQDGTQAYRQGRYAQAAESYATLADGGIQSGSLFYNLGNAYYRLGETGQAIRYFEKARRLLPSDPRIAHNLDMARSRAERPVRSAAQGGLIRLARGWPVSTLFGLGALLWAVGVVGWTWLSTQNAPSNDAWIPAWGRPLVISLAISGLLFSGLAGGIDYLQTIDRRAVVLVNQTPVHPHPNAKAGTPIARTDSTVVSAGTGPTSPPDTTLAEGTVVLLRRQQNGWTRIEAPGGRMGWTPSAALGEI